MYTTSPRRQSNGITITNRTARTFTANGFPSIASALAANPVGQTTSAPRVGKTERQFIQKGIVGNVRKNTPYYSYYSHISYPPVGVGYKYVKQYRFVPTPLYEVHYKECGVGYTGGSNTGLGDPIEQVKRKSTSGSAAALLNRAAMTNAENKALLEVVDKARNQKLDLSESLVDIDKSFLLIARRVSQVLKAWEHARHLRWFDALKELGITKMSGSQKRRLRKLWTDRASAWLEIQYGWLPLLSDIYAGVEFVKTGIQLPESTFSAVRNVSISLPTIAWEGGVAPTYWWDYSITHDMKHDVRVKHRLRVSNSALAYLTAIGLENPAYIAWVSTPFSFVVDWIVPIGDWLKAFTTPFGLTYVDGYQARRTSGSVTLVGKSWGARSPSQPIVWESKPYEVIASIVELDRIVYNNWPAPPLYIRFPFSNLKRIVSTIALISQRR